MTDTSKNFDEAVEWLAEQLQADSIYVEMGKPGWVGRFVETAYAVLAYSKAQEDAKLEIPRSTVPEGSMGGGWHGKSTDGWSVSGV